MDIYDLYGLIGGNLKKIRKEIHKTQEELAEDIDMTRGFISHLESPRIDKGVSIDTLFEIAMAYNIDIRRFFEGYEQFLKIEKETVKN